MMIIIVSKTTKPSETKIKKHVDSVEMEQKILDKIFMNYNRKIRPAATVEIKFSMHLNQIIQLIEKEQNVLLNVFIDHEWIDQRLSWNPYDFGNISILRISSEQVWT